MSARLPYYIPLLPIVVGALLLAVPFHLCPQNFIVDDGYFYPQIARYIAHGEGSTFNGIMLTNGYHPLWMAVCVAAALITSASMPLLQILATFQDLILVLCVLLLYALARVAKLRGAAFSCLALLFFNMVLGIWRLLESPLALLLQILALALVTSYFPSLEARLGRWRSPLLGVVLGLVLLARLDLIFFAATLLLYQVVRKTRGQEQETLRTRLWRPVLPGAVAALLVAPYLIWNWHTFHHLLPISGAIKSTFPHIQPWGFPVFTWPAMGAILLNSTLVLKKQRTSFDTICLLTATAAALHLAYTLSFGGLAPWYLTTGYLSVALCLMWTSTILLEKAPAFAWLEPTLAFVIFLLFFSIAMLRSVSNVSYTRLLNGQASLHIHYVEPKRALALKLRDTLPSNSRLFIFDAPGGVAFFSGLSIVPVDGLVADYNYNRELVQQGAEGYAVNHDIHYMIAPIVTGNQIYDRLDLKARKEKAGEIVELEAPLTHKSAGTIRLSDANLLFTFREVNPDLEKSFPRIGVWRINTTSDFSHSR